MGTKPTLSTATADVASALLRLLRTEPGGYDERGAIYRLQSALFTCRFDSGPESVQSLIREAVEAAWDCHPQRAPQRALAREPVTPQNDRATATVHATAPAAAPRRSR